MNEKMSFKMGVKFDVLYEVRGKSARTELQILGR